ncbi:MAG: FliA/WhiG family RNA polymerase sigma factor [Actinobacteria bacterium]|nr:FliA/WhiG family RNA polymerase sigma factor [Actinomycetota bacterium]
MAVSSLDLERWNLDAFVVSLTAAAPNTVGAYHRDVRLFAEWVARHGVHAPTKVTKSHIRSYVAFLTTSRMARRSIARKNRRARLGSALCQSPRQAHLAARCAPPHRRSGVIANAPSRTATHLCHPLARQRRRPARRARTARSCRRSNHAALHPRQQRAIEDGVWGVASPRMNPRAERLDIDTAWQRWINDKQPLARDWLVVHYASLVKFVAGRISAGLPKRVETSDLVSAGMVGLVQAIDRYVPRPDMKFESYAVPRIRGAILDSLRALDWVPRSVRARSRQIEQAIAELQNSLGRSATEQEIAQRLGIGIDQLNEWLTDVASSAVGPLDHVALDSQAPVDVSDFQRATNPDTAFESGELRRTMRDAIRKLPDNERTTLLLYYEENFTFTQIAEVLDVSESRVSQIHAKAVLTLRATLSAAQFN